MEVRDPKGKAVKCCAFTTASCRTEEPAEMRNHPSYVVQTRDKSQAVCSAAEAVPQQRAVDDQ